MGIPKAKLRASIRALAKAEPAFATALDQVGYPEPRVRDRGHVTMLRTIVGQQVSIKAAASMWAKFEAAMGADCAAPRILAATDEDLRACGLSRQKASYARSLAELVHAGALDFDALPADDEDAIALLTQIRGIGRWSAEIYLLFAEGRADIWPAGDLAVQIAIGRIMGLDERPSERALRIMAEDWRPHRGAAAIFAWHYYNNGGAAI